MGRPKGSKNKPKLTQRTPVETPKPLPQRGKEVEEPYTTLGKGSEEDQHPRQKSEPLLGMCAKCGQHAAHSWVDKLCYICHKLAEGLVWDEDQKKWIKTKGKK